MKQGTVKWFDSNKGFGFIEVEDMEEDIFVHYSAIKEEGYKTLEDGQEVMLETEKTEKGIQASVVEK